MEKNITSTNCIQLPVEGAWKRLYGGDARTNIIKKAFSLEKLKTSPIYGIYGPQESGKTSVAFAIADHFNYNLITPSNIKKATDFQLLPDSILLIDPVSAYSFEELELFTQNKPSGLIIILIATNKEEFEGLPVDTLFRMRYPTENGINSYLTKMLANYDHSLTNDDLVELSVAFNGLSFPQVNSIVVDATLACLSEERPISKEAFIDAIKTFKDIKSKYHAF